MSDLSKFLKKTFSAKQLEGVPRLTLTIQAVEAKEVGREREVKPLVSFVQDPRGLVLNASKYDALAAAHNSRDVNAWIGATVRLSHDPSVRFGSKEVGGIRMEVVSPAPVAQPA